VPLSERTTARLQLRRITLADLDAFVDLEAELRRRDAPSRRPPDREVWGEYLARFASVWDEGDLGYWTLRHNGRVAGFGGVQAKR
jgi:RimJ/RimL family protein N-acetyltransferase